MGLEPLHGSVILLLHRFRKTIFFLSCLYLKKTHVHTDTEGSGEEIIYFYLLSFFDK